MTARRPLALLLSALLLAAGCGGDDDGGTGAAPAGADVAADGCITDFDPDADYFPDKVEPTVAEQWDISYHGSYKVLTVEDSEFPDRPDLTYVLVRCGAPDPDLDGALADAPRFEVPVRRTAITHANGLAMLDELGLTDTVVAMSGALLGRATDPWYARVIEEADDPQDLGRDGIDAEVALAVEADLLVMAGFGPGYTEVADAVERGLPAVMVSNRIEPEPLGSAEWLKALAAFYDAEAEANRVFAEIEDGYEEVVATVEGALPEGYEAAYLCLGEQRGCEFMYAHGADTLNGRILATLGAENPFAAGNDAGNGMTFDYEESLGRAAGADFFVVYYEASVNRAAIAGDARYLEFEALAAGDWIANRDANSAECGATAYVRVDTLIRDYAIGVLPDRFPGEEGRCFARPA